MHSNNKFIYKILVISQMAKLLSNGKINLIDIQKQSYERMIEYIDLDFITIQYKVVYLQTLLISLDSPKGAYCDPL